MVEASLANDQQGGPANEGRGGRRSFIGWPENKRGSSPCRVVQTSAVIHGDRSHPRKWT